MTAGCIKVPSGCSLVAAEAAVSPRFERGRGTPVPPRVGNGRACSRRIERRDIDAMTDRPRGPLTGSHRFNKSDVIETIRVPRGRSPRSFTVFVVDGGWWSFVAGGDRGCSVGRSVAGTGDRMQRLRPHPPAGEQAGRRDALTDIARERERVGRID